MNDKNEIILYQPDETVKLEVRISEETVWLNRKQMACLFGRDVKTIGKHIANALAEELLNISVVANFATTARDGKTYNVEYYNLDMILSVGYRVKSRQGVLFRQWANSILKDYLLRGYALNNRLERIENQLENQQKQIADHQQKIDFFVRTSLPPVEGIFYDGNMFEPFAFVNKLIRSARERIVLIDNYVDETVLLRLAERVENVQARIYTQRTSPSFNVALAQHNNQYAPIDLCLFTQSHDRFLIIDNEVYHIGASIKDLGKKWFAFCKMELQANEILEKLSQI
ncbi:MAG: virulence RhuM family protein [Paludibacteraceae bacterium]|nr:virulence RhuM family protein [Paludibacteraceae bacterium]